jgi:hypothetical protein
VSWQRRDSRVANCGELCSSAVQLDGPMVSYQALRSCHWQPRALQEPGPQSSRRVARVASPAGLKR